MYFLLLENIFKTRIFLTENIEEPQYTPKSFLLKVESHPNEVILPSSKSPLKWRQGGRKVETPMTKRTVRGQQQKTDFQKRLAVGKQWKEGHWCNRAEGLAFQSFLGGEAAEEGSFWTLGTENAPDLTTPDTTRAGRGVQDWWTVWKSLCTQQARPPDILPAVKWQEGSSI